MPSWRDHFRCLARYNLWATERLLSQHIAALPDAEYRRDCGLFFKSIHGTLNHLAVAEHEIWLPRFADGVSPKRALSEEVEPDRTLLAQRLLDGAKRWEPWMLQAEAAR